MKAQETRKKEIAIQHVNEQKMAEKAKANPNLVKAGKLETKEMPRGATEVVATVKPADLDRALASLSAEHIETKTVKEGDLVDVVVKREDTEKAAKVLMADAEAKGYDIHAHASAAIKPSR